MQERTTCTHEDINFYSQLQGLTAIAESDVQVLRRARVKFNLTRNLEGVYIYGGRLVIEENEAIVRESTPLTLTCKFSK